MLLRERENEQKILGLINYPQGDNLVTKIFLTKDEESSNIINILS